MRFDDFVGFGPGRRRRVACFERSILGVKTRRHALHQHFSFWVSLAATTYFRPTSL
jgi:hypothetical protein